MIYQRDHSTLYTEIHVFFRSLIGDGDLEAAVQKREHSEAQGTGVKTEFKRLKNFFIGAKPLGPAIPDHVKPGHKHCSICPDRDQDAAA